MFDGDDDVQVQPSGEKKQSVFDDEEEEHTQVCASSCVAILQMEADKEGTSTVNVKFDPASTDDMPVLETETGHDEHLDEVQMIQMNMIFLVII